MNAETERTDADEAHVARCRGKLDILLEQEKTLRRPSICCFADIEAGRKYMKVYRQMKMYNDPATNPVLYAKNKKELPRNVLVMRFSALGDVAMTIPVVYSVCRSNPATGSYF